jgi:hypothetical protein
MGMIMSPRCFVQCASHCYAIARQKPDFASCKHYFAPTHVLPQQFCMTKRGPQTFSRLPRFALGQWQAPMMPRFSMIAAPDRKTVVYILAIRPNKAAPLPQGHRCRVRFFAEDTGVLREAAGTRRRHYTDFTTTSL